MVVSFESAMGPNGAHAFRQRIVIGKQCASVAVAAQWCGRKKTCAGDIRDSTAPFSILKRAEALRPIFDDWNCVLSSNRVDLPIIRHLPEETHGNERLNARRNQRCE